MNFFFFIGQGPFRSREFIAEGIVPIRVPECTQNLVDTEYNVRLGDVKFEVDTIIRSCFTDQLQSLEMIRHSYDND